MLQREEMYFWRIFYLERKVWPPLYLKKLGLGFQNWHLAVFPYLGQEYDRPVLIEIRFRVSDLAFGSVSLPRARV